MKYEQDVAYEIDGYALLIAKKSVRGHPFCVMRHLPELGEWIPVRGFDAAEAASEYLRRVAEGKTELDIQREGLAVKDLRYTDGNWRPFYSDKLNE